MSSAQHWPAMHYYQYDEVFLISSSTGDAEVLLSVYTKIATAGTKLPATYKSAECKHQLNSGRMGGLVKRATLAAEKEVRWSNSSIA